METDAWLRKAYRYVQDHRAFSSVAPVEETPEGHVIRAVVAVSLPARYVIAGQTELGVKCNEPVKLIFPASFPLGAPRIRLRDDFPRGLPHINPSRTEVSPCIYEGSLSELLQQSEWMNGILNQLVDWLEKAAADELMNHEQGWEPMRIDNVEGVAIYDMDKVALQLEKRDVVRKAFFIQTTEEESLIATADKIASTQQRCDAVFVKAPGVCEQYISRPVRNVDELCGLAAQLGVPSFRRILDGSGIRRSECDRVIIAICVRRPTPLIGSQSNIEHLHFTVEKTRDEKDRLRPLAEWPVGMLMHVSVTSPALLKSLSGTHTDPDQRGEIVMLGCGSLGSKVAIHLARNGNGPFLCIDNDVFLPHNHARHGLTHGCFDNKANALAKAICSITGVAAQTGRSAFEVDYSHSRYVIDSTASLSVRMYLMSENLQCPIISTGLFNKGSAGILMVESADKATLLCDLWAYLYHVAVCDESVREILFNPQLERVNTGQNCGSMTLIASDALISVYAALFSLRIQGIFDGDVPRSGEITIVKSDGLSSTYATHNVPTVRQVSHSNEDMLRVRVLDSVMRRIHEQAESALPNETGGVLLGSVFLAANVVVVTDILPPPKDSLMSPSQFTLGVEGLAEKIKFIERRTNGRVTYLGTWHSHPKGSVPSRTDESTYDRLVSLRNYEPTVCLIHTPEGLISV